MHHGDVVTLLRRHVYTWDILRWVDLVAGSVGSMTCSLVQNSAWRYSYSGGLVLPIRSEGVTF